MTDACLNIEPYQRSYFEKMMLASTPTFGAKRNPFLTFLASPLQAMDEHKRLARARRLKTLELQRLDKPVAKDQWAEALLNG